MAGLTDLLPPEWYPRSFGEAETQMAPIQQNRNAYDYSGQFVTPPGYNMHPGLAYALGLVDPQWMMGRTLGVIPAAGQNI